MGLCSSFSKNAIEERIISILRIKKKSFISLLAACAVIGSTTLVFATGRNALPVANNNGALNDYSWVAEPPTALPTAKQTDSPGFVERMLFVTKGEPTVKVTYGGESWEVYPAIVENESWRWYSHEEYAAHIEYVKTVKSDICSGTYADFILASMCGAEKDPGKLARTLEDIKNGIKVSRPKTIFITDGEGANSNFVDWVHWYCYGYTFRDKAGNEVDLGLFETRDELFAALRQYYNAEVSAGRLAGSEADNLYGRIAHPVRNIDEEPLARKLLKEEPFKSYNPILL